MGKWVDNSTTIELFLDHLSTTNKGFQMSINAAIITIDVINNGYDHFMESVEPNEYGPVGWTVVCSCSNPEGDYSEGFHGAVQFSGATKKEAVEGWFDHFLNS